MYWLVVNPGTTAAWEVPLAPGINTLGHDPSNPFPINHETVSRLHCQLLVTDEAVTIRDLGSTCGTFVNHVPVVEMPLAAGQTINLGEVELLLCADTGNGTVVSGGESPPPVPRRIPTQGPLTVRVPVHSPPHNGAVSAVSCKNHATVQARWVCGHCQASYCDLCVTVRGAGGDARRLCRVCYAECQPATGPTSAPEEIGFFRQLPGAFSYPWKGNGVFLLIGGTLFFLIFDWVVMLLGSLSIVSLLLTGYLFSYAKSIVASSAGGKAEPPDWPDFTDWKEDILLPFGQLIALVALTFGPAMILRWWQPGSEAFARTTVFAAAGLGALLAPMGMLALAMFDSVAALNPIALVWSILRIPVHYLVAAAAFELVVGINFIAQDWVGVLIPLPVLPGALSWLMDLYLLTVGMRILGLLYQGDRERLDWF